MRRKLIIIVLLAISAALPLRAETIVDEELRSRLSRDSILIGDQVEWTFDLKLAPGESARVGLPGEIPVPGVETLGALAVDTVAHKDGTMVLHGHMTITSFDSGSYALPPLFVLVARPDGTLDTLAYASPKLEVNTIPVDTATFEAYDIKGQIKYPLTFKEILPWIGLALLTAALVWLLVRWIRMRRQNRTLFGKPVVEDPPHITALRSLEKTRSQKLWQAGRQKQFYTQVTDALRQYIASRYDISALEQTSAEMFSDLKDKEIDPALLEKLQDLFTTADFVKFAKHTASDAENEEAIPTAVRFVNETYMQQMEEEEE